MIIILQMHLATLAPIPTGLEVKTSPSKGNHVFTIFTASQQKSTHFMMNNKDKHV